MKPSPYTLRILFTLGVLSALPSAMGFSNGPPIRRAGVPGDDGGTTCVACHRTFVTVNPDTVGKVTITASDYTPGEKQTVKVRVEHPEGLRWGFELAARQASNDQLQAGSFTPVENSIRVACVTGNAPCGGGLEWVSHMAASSQAGKPDFGEWEMEWTPPANEVGDIILFVAGNAANNSNSNAGDRIYTSQIRIKSKGACTLTKKPTLRSLANAASFSTTLAPNALGSVFGLDFGVAGRIRNLGSGDLVNGSVPKQLSCVAVEIAGQRAPITYVQTDQINFQVPTITQTGPVPVTIILNPGSPNELRSDQGTVTLARYSPAFFVFGASKSIAATTVDGKILASANLVPGGIAARPGDIVTLYGTGFGFTNPVYQAGEIPDGVARVNDPFTISIGGTLLAAADILYAGLAPNLISGVYQLNVRLPQSLSDGDVPVVITIGGVTTQTGTTIPVKR